jgi:YebC/PmpR family DNA-binding regulatory protein
MGRVFEKRKHVMFARFAKMAKTFTRIGKEIHMAVKKGGPNPDDNPRLRLVIQNAKAVNMPKTNIDSAIQRAVSKDKSDYEEVVYEGYGPHGIAVLIETATDNPTRTVANVRLAFTKCGGALGKTGSLEFLFERKGIFQIDMAKRKLEDLELELIDFGAEEIEEEDGKAFIYVAFTDFGKMQKGLEDMGIPVISAEKERFANTTVELDAEGQAEVIKLIERLEDDDDVQAVYHNLKLD